MQASFPCPGTIVEGPNMRVNAFLDLISSPVLSYTDAPECKAPQIENHGFYEPSKETYKHLESISHECNSGYALPPSGYLLTCVRELYDNGTLTGVWSPVPAPCEVTVCYTVTV